MVDACLGALEYSAFLNAACILRARRQSVCIVPHMRFPNAPESHLGARCASASEKTAKIAYHCLVRLGCRDAQGRTTSPSIFGGQGGLMLGFVA